IGTVMLLVLLISYFIGRSFSNRFAGVVDALIDESDRIGALQLDRPVQIEVGSREFARLVDAQERMRGMLLDATRGLEAKLAERTRELAAREAYFRPIFENSGSGIVSRTRDKGTLRANQRYLDFLGYTLEE